MKANAPERIWIDPANDLPKLSGHIDKDSVEYIRKDAFIEKACDAYCTVCDTKECQGCAECSWVIKFRKQLMKIL